MIAVAAPPEIHAAFSASSGITAKPTTVHCVTDRAKTIVIAVPSAMVRPKNTDPASGLRNRGAAAFRAGR
jgi:NADH:ubiquinone oxidoreductase subunit F (NADH-binding)